MVAAAKELYVSQPALSAMIAKLERALGFKIFDRSTSPLSVTQKGQIYFDMLTEIRESEARMSKRLEQLKTKPSKQLSVGTSVFLADCILPEVVARLREEFPDLNIKLNMGEKGTKTVLSELLESREVDLIILNRYSETTESAELIKRSESIVAARRDLAGIDKLLPFAVSREEILSGKPTREIGNTELPLFASIEFITTDTVTNYMRRITELLGNNYSLSPISVKNLRNLGMNYEMMRAGLGATVVSDIDLLHPIFDDERIVYFAFKGRNRNKGLYAVRRKGEELSDEARRFVDLFSMALCVRASILSSAKG